MTTFWIKDGKIVVNAAGEPILCDTCPCQAEWCEDVCEATYYVDISAPCLDTCTGTFTLSYNTTSSCEWNSGNPITDRCIASLWLFDAPVGGNIWLLTVSDEVNSNECNYERAYDDLGCPDGVYTRQSGCGDCPATVTVYS